MIGYYLISDRWVMKMWDVRQEDPVTSCSEDSVEAFVFAQYCTASMH
jgi:hypothetical protein